MIERETALEVKDMVRRMIWLTIASFAVLFSGLEAGAAELVVVEAHGIRLAAGTAVDGAKPLSLEEGQSVTLLSTSGQVVTLEGPLAVAPDDNFKGGSSDMAAAIRALASARSARTSEVGVVRGENDVKLPDPWLVDVSHPGTVCVRPGQPVVLWREPPLAEVKVIFSPKDQSWHESGVWPARADRLQLPANMPLRDYTDYVIDLNGRLAPVTLRLIPQTVNNDAMRIGFMEQLGCGNQAGALLAAYQK